MLNHHVSDSGRTTTHEGLAGATGIPGSKAGWDGRGLMNDGLMITAYGRGEKDKGVVTIRKVGGRYDRQLLPVEGKCNFCIQAGDRLYVSVQKDHPYLLEYRCVDGAYVCETACPTRYFYSHGVFYGGLLLLASFSDGADGIYDRSLHREVDVHVHARTGYPKTGRSHYIGVTAGGRQVYAVDNALQQIYLYDIVDSRFVVRHIREFGEEDIRLMPYSPYSGCYYLNTESTDRIYVLAYTEGRFHIQSITELTGAGGGGKCFSGGNAVSPDGQRLCVTLRGDDRLYYFKILPEGDLVLLDRAPCGRMPRDVFFQDPEHLWVTCTDSDAVEGYAVRDDRLIKEEEIAVGQPVTFCA